LNDLGPAATFIAANYNLPFELGTFVATAERILDELDAEIGWMYQTLHSDGKTKGRINFTVWSEVFSCPECTQEVVFADEALDAKTKRVRDEFSCPGCGARLGKNNMERLFETLIDPSSGLPWKRISLRPVLIDYNVGKSRFEKRPDADDLEVLKRIDSIALPLGMPIKNFPVHDTVNGRCRSSGGCCHSALLADKGITHVHHAFLARQSHSLAALWSSAIAVEDTRLRNILLFFVEQAIWGMSVLNRYQPIQQGRPGGSQVNRQLSGVYYLSSLIAEVSPWYNLGNRLTRLKKHAFARQVPRPGFPTSVLTISLRIPLLAKILTTPI
jgi:predicted RNA-binding Zn-ribbon protein involved in translation (DUF1610 family)